MTTRYLGVDLGGTKIHAAISDADGTVLAEHVAPTDGDLVEALAAVEAELLARTDGDRVAIMGLGGAGVPTGESFDLAPNLDLGDLGRELPFVARLEERLGHPVVLENDVNVAALGELQHGVGLRHDDFAVVASGTGVGMGLVLGGRLVRGARGAAGEIGYLPIGADPFDPATHVNGPFEEMVAGASFAAHYLERAGVERTPREIFDRLDADPDAAATVAQHARWLALGISAVRAVADPEVVVLTGGIGSRPELLPLVRDELAALGAGDLEVLPSALGSSAAVLGALHLAREAAAAAREELTR